MSLGWFDTAAAIRSRIELVRLIQLGWPILLAQSSQTAMGLADTLMASWAGVDELAAISLGAGLWLPLFLSLSGVMLALTPIVAHLVGAARETDTPTQLHHSLILALILSLLGVILLNNSGPLLDWLGVEPKLRERTLEYLFAISWGLPALLFYQAIRSFAEGFGQTRATMKIGVLAVIINIPLNYVLIFGEFSFPELGGVGCGWASSLAFWVMLICGVVYLKSSRHFNHLKVWHSRPVVENLIFKEHLLIGLPIAFSLLIETSMFCVIALLLAKYGPEVISAHQIALSVSSFIFMLPLSLCLAMTIRVGNLNGARAFAQARQVAQVGLVLALLLASFNFALLLSFNEPIAALYADRPEVLILASQLLGLAALYQYSDAIQLTCTGALRGYKDTRVPLYIAAVAYWLIGLPSGYLLAEHFDQGPGGYWIGILIGLSIGAVLLFTRFQKISKHALLAGALAPTSLSNTDRL